MCSMNDDTSMIDEEMSLQEIEESKKQPPATLAHVLLVMDSWEFTGYDRGIATYQKLSTRTKQ